jgi:hypothetical protein
MILVELEITPGATRGAYAVAANSPAGASAGTVRLDVAALLGRRRELAASVLASAVTTRAGLSGLERPVREVGRALFEGVFAGRVYGRYTASVQEAARRGEPLRVVLRLRAPELAGLPWETLFDRRPGSTGASGSRWCATCRPPSAGVLLSPVDLVIGHRTLLGHIRRGPPDRVVCTGRQRSPELGQLAGQQHRRGDLVELDRARHWW